MQTSGSPPRDREIMSAVAAVDGASITAVIASEAIFFYSFFVRRDGIASLRSQ